MTFFERDGVRVEDCTHWGYFNDEDEISKATKVFVIPGSDRFHSDFNCRAIQNTKRRVKMITLPHALEHYHHWPCSRCTQGEVRSFEIAIKHDGANYATLRKPPAEFNKKAYAEGLQL